MKLCHRAKQKSEAAFEPTIAKNAFFEKPLNPTEIQRKVLRNLPVSFQNWPQIELNFFQYFGSTACRMALKPLCEVGVFSFENICCAVNIQDGRYLTTEVYSSAAIVLCAFAGQDLEECYLRVTN
jgi:hypothetical protein